LIRIFHPSIPDGLSGSRSQKTLACRKATHHLLTIKLRRSMWFLDWYLSCAKFRTLEGYHLSETDEGGFHKEKNLERFLSELVWIPNLSLDLYLSTI
jgi:hypothetical protein